MSSIEEMKQEYYRQYESESDSECECISEDEDNANDANNDE